MNIRKQSGIAVILAVLGILTVVVAGLTLAAVQSRQASTERLVATEALFTRIQDALTRFVEQNGRLPCPANGTSATGRAEPDNFSVDCTVGTGVVPWTSLGLNKNDVTDPWGNLISYRVPDGTNGLTREEGVNMLQCATNAPHFEPLTGGVYCALNNAHSPPQRSQRATYLAAKGTSVTDNGTVVNQVAYVLISHGPTGRGSFSSGGQANSATAMSGAEFSHTRENGPFVKQSFNKAVSDPGNVNHFDDLVVYQTVETLIKKANRDAREWPFSGSVFSTKLNAPKLSEALGTTINAGQNTGQNTIALNNGAVTMTGVSSGDDTFGIRQSSITGEQGIGVGGTGNVTATISSVRFDLAVTRRKFAITLNEFGSGTVSGTPYQEVVEFRFLLDGTAVTTITKYSCNLNNPLASYSVDVGSDYNAVVVAPMPAQPNVGLSSFLISEVSFCAATDTVCSTTLAAPANVCP